jgi:hypothetical protein
MQTLLDEIHRVTDSKGDGVAESDLSVAYERPLDFYLTECLALATAAAGHPNAAERVPIARALEPEWTKQFLRGRPMLPTGVGGARLGLFLCALGISPFEVTAMTSRRINMDTLQYRATRLATVFTWFQTNGGGTQSMGAPSSTYIAPTAPLAENTDRGSMRADMPIEFLMAMIRMLHHTGVTITLRQSLTELIPAWYVNSNPPTPVARKIYRRASNRPITTEVVYTASLGEASAASALMRAVAVVELARQHSAQGSPELAALPKLLDWDIHRLGSGEDVSTISFAFSVVVAHQDQSEIAGVNAKLDAFMYAMNLYTGAFPVAVPPQAAALDANDGLVLLLEAFFGAQWPGLPQYDATQRTLWRTRRENPNNAQTWFAAPNKPVPRPSASETVYSFQTSGHVVQQQMMQAMISMRLRANSWCRKCATPLHAGSTTLVCANGKCVS